MPNPNIFYAITVFIFGLIMGSFYNVVIYRVPNHQSIVYGSSHCPNCEKTIQAIDLIPVLSFIFLKGKCRYCKQTIAWRYPLVELLTALLFTLVYLRYGYSLYTSLGIIMSSLLIIIAFIDIDTMEISDTLQILLLIIALCTLFISPLPWLDHLIGLFIISLPFLLIALITGAMGGGDIKLIAVGGLLLGYQAVLVAFFIASVSGGIYASYLLIFKHKGRKTMVAFGPFICLGIYFAYLYGFQLYTLYLSLFIKG